MTKDEQIKELQTEVRNLKNDIKTSFERWCKEQEKIKELQAEVCNLQATSNKNGIIAVELQANLTAEREHGDMLAETLVKSYEFPNSARLVIKNALKAHKERRK